MAKYKFKLKYLNIKNNFSTQQVKWFYRISIALPLLFIIIYVPAIFYRNYKAANTAAQIARTVYNSSRITIERPGVADFKFPGEFFNFDAKITPSRSINHRWLLEETHFFWVDPGDTFIRNLPHDNHDLLRSYLLEVAANDKDF